MNTNIKKLINPIIFLAVGLFNFIFLALDALGATISGWGASYSSGLSSGYGLLGLNTEGATAGFLLILAGICSIITIVSSIALLAFGAIKLLKALNVNVAFLDQYEGQIAKGEKVALVENFAVQILSFVCLLIFALANGESYGGASASYYPSIGAYLLLLFAAAAFVVVKFVLKDTDDAPNLEYVCVQCGKVVKAGSNFCDACGGSVKTKVKYPVIYVCSKCEKKASAKDKFCAACGAEVVKKEVIPTVYCCAACGAKASANEKFCAACGGTIVEKKADAE